MLSLPLVRVVRYVDQPCAVLVRPSCVLPVEGRVLQPPALVLPLRCTLACLEGASPSLLLHVDVSRDDSFILGAHSPIRAYGMSVTYRYLSQCRELVFLSGRPLRRAFWSVLYTRCHSDLFISVLLASLGRRDVLSLLGIRLIRGLLSCFRTACSVRLFVFLRRDIYGRSSYELLSRLFVLLLNQICVVQGKCSRQEASFPSQIGTNMSQ